MLYVDYRQGSAQLAVSLERAGLPVFRDAVGKLADLEFGDVTFNGRGLNGVALTIGIEHKTVADLVSSLRTERLQGHQLPGMRAANPGEKPRFDFCWLIVEGKFVYDARGMLQRRSGARAFRPLGMTVDELMKRVLILHLRGGLNPVFCAERRDTVRWVAACYRALTDKDLDKHLSHLGIYTPPALVKMSPFRETMRTLPGVGAQVSLAAERAFGGSIRRAINASVDTWADLQTMDDEGKQRRFGNAKAAKLCGAIQ